MGEWSLRDLEVTANLQIFARTQGACSNYECSIVFNSEKNVLTVEWLVFLRKENKVKVDWTVDTRSGNRNDGVLIVAVLKLLLEC